ncbi:hypothetical protein HAX54_026686 [Datura stramonium]|uniref:Fungal lipase-type domain-containing protein n=1 Tax=Datura stramonium TaxID=4076 RepID=A0ABS8V459_DATST|nr:hypothetical protein [Datura stramonium]
MKIFGATIRELMGYVAVSTDPEEIKRLGRRDIVVAWRGTVTYLEWIHDLKDILHPAHFRDDPNIKIEKGFFGLYTMKEKHCHYSSFSAREQILAEINRLIEKYEGEELSITITGHSLGAALALLSAYDIAEMKLNILRSANSITKRIPITVFSFAGPRVGNLNFKERGGVSIDHYRSLLKPNSDLGCAHNLEGPFTPFVDGYHGKARAFRPPLGGMSLSSTRIRVLKEVIRGAAILVAR